MLVIIRQELPIKAILTADFIASVKLKRDDDSIFNSTMSLVKTIKQLTSLANQKTFDQPYASLCVVSLEGMKWCC